MKTVFCLDGKPQQTLLCVPGAGRTASPTATGGTTST